MLWFAPTSLPNVFVSLNKFAAKWVKQAWDDVDVNLIIKSLDAVEFRLISQEKMMMSGCLTTNVYMRTMKMGGIMRMMPLTFIQIMKILNHQSQLDSYKSIT